MKPSLSHIHAGTIAFSAVAIAAFWFGLRFCLALPGKPWRGVAWRVACALLFFALGIVMIFVAAFGLS